MNEYEQALGGASGASSTAAELTPERRIEGLRNLRNGYGTVSAAVGFWKSLHDEDLIEVYAELAEVSGGTSTGSARPPQPDLSASEGERLRHLAEQIISPDVLVVGGESEELARGVLRLLARVVRLEEALRGYHDLIPALALCANECGEQLLYTTLHQAIVRAEAVLSGSTPPSPPAPDSGPFPPRVVTEDSG